MHQDQDVTDATCCTDECASGKRNRFFRGKQMKAGEFRAEQSYFINRRRLVNRAVLGWGVVYGFALEGPRRGSPRGHEGAEALEGSRTSEGSGSAERSAAPESSKPAERSAALESSRSAERSSAPEDSKPAERSSAPKDSKPAEESSVHEDSKPAAGSVPAEGSRSHEEFRPRPIAVGEGFALDVHGREVLLTERVVLTPENTFVLDTSNGGCCARPLEASDCQDSAHYLLRAHYAEHHFGDVKLPAGCGCGEAEKNFTCETVLFSLTRLGHNADCPCAERRCDRECDCRRSHHHCKCGRGSHCLCQWVTERVPADDPRPLCKWHQYWTDPSSGVGLACVQLQHVERCKPLLFERITDDCSPRRVVKNNDLLYDLVRGCDLTRISKVSWGKWHRREEPVPWKDFRKLFGPGPIGNSKVAYTEFTVEFSGPVLTRSVTIDCFELKVLFKSEDSGWHETQSARLVDVKHEPPGGDDPPGTTRSVRLGVSPRWYREVTTNASKFEDEETTVQIEIRGDLILDCHGQAVDANARGFALSQEHDHSVPEPSGNGSPGGTFVSMFRVGKAPGGEK